MGKPDQQQSDEAIADLLTAVAKQYRAQIRADTEDVTATRLEVVRKLDLIRQSVRGLMKPRQQKIER